MQPALLYTVQAIHDFSTAARAEGKRIALVPTMGALHSGHISLVELARKHADVVIVSIFVNPTQFGPNEDYSRYPRDEKTDTALLAGKADAVYMPNAQAMYPEGFSTNIHVKNISDELCGAFRPGHFDGVATVVAKLLLQAVPHVAVFGEKDYQQLYIIRRMVADLNIPVEIIGAPILRELDGLALSSRNRYLSVEERQTAPLLHTTLQQVAAALKRREPVSSTLEAAKNTLIASGFTKVDYMELRDLRTLAPTTKFPARLLVAAWMNTTRLIDNIEIQYP